MISDISQPGSAELPLRGVPLPTSSDESNSTSQYEYSEGMILNHVDSAALAAACQEELDSPKDRELQGNGKSGGTDSPAIEESTEARLERLGRQRPEVFGSIWAEIGFVFSISMSQVLSVSISNFFRIAPLTPLGILRV